MDAKKEASLAADAPQPLAAPEYSPDPAVNPPPGLKSTNTSLGLPSFYFEPPSKYTNKTIDPFRQLNPPPLDWLARSWTVTHSTLEMWRSARNVRITYTPLPTEQGKPDKVDDLVEYEPTSTTGKLKTVKGVDTRSQTNGWDWRGKSWLFFVTSHWEILGWGEVMSPDGKEVVERWAVTWFAPTVFTKEGVDIYSDRREGVSKETYERILEGLKGMVVEDEKERQSGLQSGTKRLVLSGQEEVVRMLNEDLREVEIKLPWVEG